MQRFIIFLLIFVASVFVGFKIAQDPGFAFFSYQQWSLEMPLWFALFSFLLLFLLGYLLLWVFNSVDFSLYRWRNWLRWRRKYKSYSKTNRGLVELIEGNWSNAEYYLLEGIPQSDAPLINYLAAAKAAQERGAYDKRDAYLRKAHAIAPNAEVAIGLTQAQLQLNQNQLEQALATLGHLRTIAPKQKQVLKMLERVYVHLGDWQELLKLLPSLRKAKIINAEQEQNFEKRVYLELLRAAQNKPESEIRDVWNSIPKKAQNQPELIACYARELLAYPHTAVEVEDMLYKSLKKNWDTDLVKLYGLLQAPEAPKQLAKAERWLKDNPSQAALFLTLGRLSMRCQLWGRARDYFEASLKLDPTPETYAEYGRLLESLGDEAAAVQSYRDGILLSAEPMV